MNRLIFFDELQAYVRCIRLGTTSFTLEQVLAGQKQRGNVVVFAQASVNMVTIDMKSMKPSPLPKDSGTKIRELDRLVA